MDNIKSKLELKKYLDGISNDEGLKYLENWLINRQKEKNLIYAPTEFECRSLLFPSLLYIHKKYGKNSYESLCSKIGLKVKYNYDVLIDASYSPNQILVDSREQIPYRLDIPMTIQKLNFADYCPSPNPENMFIERKELTDWAGVMSKGYTRFNKELQRAKDNNAYLIILIESSYNDLLSINYLPHTKFIQARSSFLMKRMRDLYLKFDNFQMVAGGTRKECIELFNKLIRIKNIKNIDIQYNLNKI